MGVPISASCKSCHGRGKDNVPLSCMHILYSCSIIHIWTEFWLWSIHPKKKSVILMVFSVLSPTASYQHSKSWLKHRYCVFSPFFFSKFVACANKKSSPYRCKRQDWLHTPLGNTISTNGTCHLTRAPSTQPSRHNKWPRRWWSLSFLYSLVCFNVSDIYW